MEKHKIPMVGIFGNGNEFIVRSGNLYIGNGDKVIGNIFDNNILNDLSCKHFQATTFEFAPVITVNRLKNGAFE